MGGFSASGATVILLIGVLISAGIAIPIIEETVTETSNAFSDQHERLVEAKNANINVTSSWDDNTGNGNPGGTLTLNITNTGTTDLGVNDTDFLIDGQYYMPDTATVNGSADRTFFTPGETLVVTFSLSFDPNRVQVTIETGYSVEVYI